MFTAIATKTGWNVYRNGNPAPVATFEKLATIKRTVAKMGGNLTIIINGYQVN